MKFTVKSNPVKVKELLASGRQSWVTIAAMLVSYEESGYWQQFGYLTYSSWLHDLAKELGLKDSLLWRYRRALVFYYQLEAQSPNRLSGEDLATVSPDNLDLLEKISRVVPPDDVYDLARRVLKKEVGRRELLLKWQALRGLLEGKTARGRGVRPPTLDLEYVVNADIYHADKTLSMLEEIGPHWLGLVSPSRYLVLRNATFAMLNRFQVDALVVTQDKEDDELTIHGIDVKVALTDDYLTNEQWPDERYFDLLWLAISCKPAQEAMERLPGHIGVIVAEGLQVEILRNPTYTRHSGALKAAVLNALLLQFLPK